MLTVPILAALTMSLAPTNADHQPAFGPADDDNAAYEAQQARQRAEDAEQQERYQREQ